MPAELSEGLRHTGPAGGDVREALSNALIRSYEQAIQDGLPPFEALSLMLEWVAVEVSRLPG